MGGCSTVLQVCLLSSKSPWMHVLSCRGGSGKGHCGMVVVGNLADRNSTQGMTGQHGVVSKTFWSQSLGGRIPSPSSEGSRLSLRLE